MLKVAQGLSLKARFGPLEIGVLGAVKEAPQGKGAVGTKSMALKPIQGPAGERSQSFGRSVEST